MALPMAVPSLASLKINPTYLEISIPNESHFRLGCIDLIELEKAKVLNRQAAYQEHQTELYAVYEYAKLVQRMFLLSDPTKSRRASALVPINYTQYLQWCMSSPEECDKTINALIGLGSVGFPQNRAEASKYFLVMIFDKESNAIVSAASVIVKLVNMGSYYRSVLEVWGVLTDPLYMGSGAASLLLLMLQKVSLDLVKYANLHPQLAIFSDEQLQNGISLQLEVAKNSFPFIEFIDRFVFYARVGFCIASGTILVVKPDGTPTTLQLTNYIFRNKYLTGQTENKVESHTGTISLAKWKEENAACVAGNDTILFETMPNSVYDIDKIVADMGILFRNLKKNDPAPLPTMVYGFISHSSYMKNPILNGLETFTVPSNVELVIMNSPGYFVTMPVLEQNWYAAAKYFRNIPIKLLKNLFPPFKHTIIRGEKFISMESFQKFIYATSGGILINTTDVDKSMDRIQIHAYSQGDACPNLMLESTLGQGTKDFSAVLYGLFDMSYTHNYKELALTNNRDTLNPSSMLFTECNDFKTMLKQGNIKWPDDKFRIFPTREDLFKLETDLGYETISFSLKDYLAKNNFKQPTRIFLFSCGGISEQNNVNKQIQDILTRRTNYVINLTLSDYRKYIGRIGEVIYDIYNETLPAGYSPATSILLQPKKPKYHETIFAKNQSKKRSKSIRKSKHRSKNSKGTYKKSKAAMSVNTSNNNL